MCWQKFTLKYILVKMLDFEDQKKKFLQAFRLKKKKQATYKGRKTKLVSELSMATYKSRQ